MDGQGNCEPTVVRVNAVAVGRIEKLDGAEGLNHLKYVADLQRAGPLPMIRQKARWRVRRQTVSGGGWSQLLVAMVGWAAALTGPCRTDLHVDAMHSAR